MSFGIYMAGFVVLLAGMLLGAYFLHVPPRWIGVGALVMVGIGVLSGVTHTRRRDPE